METQDVVSKPLSCLALVQKGVVLNKLRKLHYILVTQKILIKNLTDFNSLLLPIFSQTIHGVSNQGHNPELKIPNLNQIHITCTQCRTFYFKFECKSFFLNNFEPTDIFCCFDYNALHFDNQNQTIISSSEITQTESSDLKSQNNENEFMEQSDSTSDVQFVADNLN